MVLGAISIILTIVTLIYYIIGLTIILECDKLDCGNVSIRVNGTDVDGSKIRDLYTLIAPLSIAIYGILIRMSNLNENNQTYNVMQSATSFSGLDLLLVRGL